jgi:hypothetical protein
MLEKVETENNLSDTPGNMFNIGKTGIQIYNKLDFAITERDPKMFKFYHREKRVTILQ